MADIIPLDQVVEDVDPSSISAGLGVPDIIPHDQVLDDLSQTAVLNSPAEAIAAGFGKMLNGLTLGAGDEITSGINALWDTMPRAEIFGVNVGGSGASLDSAYNQRLNQARELDATMSNQYPIDSAALDLVPSIALPIPKIFSAQPGALTAAKNIAKGGALGAAYGGAYGFNSGEGGLQNRAKNAAFGLLAGGATGGVLQTGAEGLQGLGSLMSRVLESPASKAKTVVSDLLKKFMQSAPEDAVTAIEENVAQYPFASNMRTAELANDPGLGLLTKILEKIDPQAGLTGAALDEARALQRMEVFGEHQGPVRSGEATGNLIRNTLEESKGLQSGRVSEAYSLANEGEGLANIFPAKANVSDRLAALDSKNIAIDDDSRALIDAFRKTNPNKLTIQELQAQRQDVGELLGQIRGRGPMATNKEKRGAKLLKQLFRDLADAEVSSGSTFTPEQIKNIQRGRALATEEGQLFDQGGVGKALKVNGYDDYRLDASKVFDTVISSPEQARQVVNALKVKGVEGQPAALSDSAIQALQAKLMDEFTGKTNLANEFTAKTFDNQWKNLEPIAREVLTADQIKAIQSVRNDLVKEANFRASIGNASKGNSVTAQDASLSGLVKDYISGAIRSKTGVLGTIFKGIGDIKAQKIEKLVNENLFKLVFDPQFAHALLRSLENVGAADVEKIANTVVLSALAPTVETEGLLLSSQQQKMQNGGNSRMYTQQQIAPRVELRETRQQGPNASQENKPLASLLNKILYNTDNPLITQGNNMSGKLDAANYMPALFNQESGGRANAVSSADAKGVGQLMDATGRELFQKYKDQLSENASPEKYSPFNEAQNAFLSQKYLQELLDRFGDPELALTAYNQGPERVARLLKTTGGSSLSDILPYLGKDGKAYAAAILSKISPEVWKV